MPAQIFSAALAQRAVDFLCCLQQPKAEAARAALKGCSERSV